MKLRTTKKAIKAIRDGRKTPLLRKVRLSNITDFENHNDKNHGHHRI